MIVDLLKALREKYTSIRLEKEEEYEFVATQITETKKFIELLQSESESSFTQFTPRTVTNKNTKKLDELTEKLGELTAQKTSLENEINELNSWLLDIDDGIKELFSSLSVPTKEVHIDKGQIKSVSISNTKKDKGTNEKLPSINSSIEQSDMDDLLKLEIGDDERNDMMSSLYQDVSSNKEESPKHNMDAIKAHLNRIVSFLPADPMRARIELQNLVKVL